ncbi:Hypothetical predicted protein [Mytilus galloprovincialis]|uniref:Uncharacterized protein n=1 Tax=Mytilus galloprovincialis TaxID=29158 RepID=A0A8B6BMF9_MYTGA|nr:Hypothetical predicted protein [Mytilus galloprovincialis]
MPWLREEKETDNALAKKEKVKMPWLGEEKKNLTQYRTGLTQKLSDLKYNHKIFAYWTSDGRIFAKTTEKGTKKKKLIKNYDDITALETTTDDDNQQQEPDLSPGTTNQNSDENHNNGTY